jgi:uncharacterized GH25 family protein
VNALVNRSLLAIVAVAATALLGIGVAAMRLPAASQPAAKATTVRAAQPAAAAKDSTVSGRVLGPAGKPVAGAELLLVGDGKKPPKRLGATDAGGRFTVNAPRGKRWVMLLARAPGVGADFIDLGKAPPGGIELRLVKDHPIRGRIIDTEGKPVSGVTVTATHVGGYRDNSLDSFLTAWRKRSPHEGLPSGVKHVWDERVFPPTKTDRDGKFTLTGMGAERLVTLRLRGPGIAESELWVVNRAGFDPSPYNQATADTLARMRFGPETNWLLSGPQLAVVAEAEKPIHGVVKDRDTGKPRAGVKVTLSRNGNELAPIVVSATTDAQGRYQIHGARKASAYMVEVASDPASGHMACQAHAADTPGYGALTIDLAVKKGVVITGRVIDGGTGKAIPGFVMASVLAGNASAKDYPEFKSSAWFGSLYTDPDGSFRVVTTPGPVILMGGPDTSKMPEGELARFLFKPSVSDPKYPKYFATKIGREGFFLGLGGSTSHLQGNFCKVLVIEPGTDVVKQDIVLQRASALPVKVVGPRGQPVADTWATGISPQDWHFPVRIARDTCSAYHLQPGKPRLLVFHDASGKQFGTKRLKGNEKAPVVVKLGPGGTVTGRLVDETGAPIAGATVRLYHRERTAEEIHANAHRARSIETDAAGKFQIDDVVPGIDFSLLFTRGTRTFETVENIKKTAPPGKPLDLGAVKAKPRRGSVEE